MENRITTKKLTILSLSLAYAMILSYVESLFPFFYGVPGMKLGLPNMAIVFILYVYGSREGILINILRIVLTGFLFGSLFGILFSVFGALFSFIFMVLFKKMNFFDMGGVSVIGGIAHNIGQLFVACFIVKTSGILFYLPPLLIAGAITGYVNGFIAERMKIHLEKSLTGRFL
ncbi:Gx transporter family protein [Butyrivibrio sp. NC2002]|uniref:Gx transporter family protein n=1 Tax=Butyrivibrio sp. NC2002 TaxID=1410610 RepID=UPI00055EA11F|nr:Gx transporter family protein [Butyrivibrio sp. NC2002]